MGAKRYLCSDLVVLERSSGPSVVNLEEIGEDFAVFESEVPFELNERLCLNGGTGQFHGAVQEAEQHEFGWRIVMEISPLTRWSPELFTPQHMLDPERLQRSAKLE